MSIAFGLSSSLSVDGLITISGSELAASGAQNRPRWRDQILLTNLDSGALALQIASAAGVLSLNSATGLLTLTSAPTSAGLIGVSNSGTTVYVSGMTGLALTVALNSVGTTISGNLTATGVALGTQIAAAQLAAAGAGVLSLNGVSGGLTLAGGPGNAGYVGVSTSGTTLYVSGNAFPSLTGVTFAGGSTISGTVAGGVHVTTPAFGQTLRINGNVDAFTAANAGTYSIGGASALTAADATTLLINAGGFTNVTVPNGNVGVGSPTTPLARFHVSGGDFRVDASGFFLGGLFLGRTNDYTTSGVASIAQLLAASGWLTNSATSNVVYTTGAQTVTGPKTFNTGVWFATHTAPSGGLNFGPSISLYSSAPTVLTTSAAIFEIPNSGIIRAGGTNHFTLSAGVTTSDRNLIPQADADSSNWSLGTAVKRWGSVHTSGLYVWKEALFSGGSKMAGTAGGGITLTPSGAIGPFFEATRTGVSIGKTNPRHSLDVSGNAIIGFDGVGILYGDRGAGATPYKFIEANSSNVVIFGDGGIGNEVRMIGNRLTYYTTAGGGTEYMRLTNAGLLGIGIAAPVEKLHVSGGNLRVDGSTFLGITGGDVGIGTTTPAYKLAVSGSVGVSGSVFARSYQMAVSGASVPSMVGGNPAPYTIDFNGAGLQTLTVTGATLISGVNYTAGGAVTLRMNLSGSTPVALSFPALWVSGWVTDVPATLATGRFAVLTLNSFTTSDTGVMLAWAIRS